MNDAERRFCHDLAKAVTSSGTYTYQGEATAGGIGSIFRGSSPSPWGLRAASRLSGLRSKHVAGSAQSQSLLVGQAVRAIQRGKRTSGHAIRQLAASTARRAPVVSTAAPGQALKGSGGSGYTGAPATQLGQQQTQGNYIKPPTPPQPPTP
jgi:hypothetical protein